MGRRVLFLLAAALGVLSVSAADDKGSKAKLRPGDAAYALPVPDVLSAMPLADRPLPFVGELRAIIRHIAAQQHGIDVSHYQGRIDWDRVAGDGNVKFAYIKATEGSDLVDEYYERNLRGARRAGIPVGVYHFYRPNASLVTQLQNFRTTVEPWQHDLIPVIDVEKRGKGSLSQFQRGLRAFLKEVEQFYGVKPIIYTGVNFYAKYLEGQFTGYRFMVARYAEEFPGLSEDVPIVLWQYSSTGRVDGIKGHVDRSVFLDRYSVADIMLPTTESGR